MAHIWMNNHGDGLALAVRESKESIVIETKTVEWAEPGRVGSMATSTLSLSVDEARELIKQLTGILSARNVDKLREKLREPITDQKPYPNYHHH